MSILREEVARIVRLQRAANQSKFDPVVSTGLLDPFKVLRVAASADATSLEEALLNGDASKLVSMGARLSRFAKNAPERSVDGAIETLWHCMSATQKKIVKLRADEKMPYQQIARKLAMKLKHVRQAETASLCLANRSIELEMAVDRMVRAAK